MRAGIPVLVAVLVLAAAGCKEGDSISTESLQPNAVFDAASPEDVTEELVTLRQGSASGGRIVLDVVVAEVAGPVSSVALTVTYPDGFSSWVRCLDGDLFPTGDPPSCEETEPGELLIFRGVGNAPGVAVDGERVALSIELLVFGVTEGSIVFEGQNLEGGSALLDADVEPIAVAWFGGLLRGV